MKLRPGCGCLVLILGIMNLLLAVVALFGLSTGRTSASPMAVGFVLVFFANMGICLVVGLASVRKEAAQRRATQGAGGGDEGEETDVDVED
jgi:hypothetical protein